MRNVMPAAFDMYVGQERDIPVGKREDNRPLGRPRRRWEYNIERIFRK
jgi:hypothetical protein